MNEDETTVIFRRWKGKEGAVFALFPEIPEDTIGYLCLSYEHIGQHGAANPLVVLSLSRPATAEEYADLKAELEAPPYEYRLVVKHRESSKMRQRRFQDAANLRGQPR